MATDLDQLDRVPVHDAWFDPAEMVHDPQRGTLSLRFAEELAQDDPQFERYLVRCGRVGFSREYRVSFRDWLMVIHGVQTVSAKEGWADMGMLLSLDFDPSASEVLVESNDMLRVAVDRLHVEAAAQGVRWMRRHVNALGLTSDRPW